MEERHEFTSVHRPNSRCNRSSSNHDRGARRRLQGYHYDTRLKLQLKMASVRFIGIEGGGSAQRSNTGIDLAATAE